MSIVPAKEPVMNTLAEASTANPLNTAFFAELGVSTN